MSWTLHNGPYSTKYLPKCQLAVCHGILPYQGNENIIPSAGFSQYGYQSQKIYPISRNKCRGEKASNLLVTRKACEPFVFGPLLYN